jgi:RHS repeat-associated protein
VILLAEHDEPILAAKKKRQPGASSWPTSTLKNRVWGFENTPSGRPCAEPQLSWETATGSVQYTYQIASGRAEWLSRDPLPFAEMRQGPNLYDYVTNDPLRFTDPFGLCTYWEKYTGLPDKYRVDAIYVFAAIGATALTVAGGGAYLSEILDATEEDSGVIDSLDGDDLEPPGGPPWPPWLGPPGPF